jgi:hypothetical protein
MASRRSALHDQTMTQDDEPIDYDESDVPLPVRVAARIQAMITLIGEGDENGETSERFATKTVSRVAEDIAAILPTNISDRRIATLLQRARAEISRGDFRTIEDAARTAGMTAFVEQAIEWLVPPLLRELDARKRLN